MKIYASINSDFIHFWHFWHFCLCVHLSLAYPVVSPSVCFFLFDDDWAVAVNAWIRVSKNAEYVPRIFLTQNKKCTKNHKLTRHNTFERVREREREVSEFCDNNIFTTLLIPAHRRTFFVFLLSSFFFFMSRKNKNKNKNQNQPFTQSIIECVKFIK